MHRALHSAMVMALVAGAPLACTTGEGEGWVKSEQLFVTDCWDGPFDLQPTFFGGNPNDDSLTIRVQRGDNLREVSDGVTIMIDDLPKIRESSLGSAVQIGMPSGTSGAAAPPVTLSLFLHDSCHEQNGAVYAVSGSITFASLFSGDPNESDADERLTEATFNAEVANAADAEVLAAGAQSPDEPVRTSQVEGWFRFFFQRGQPAQPFP